MNGLDEFRQQIDVIDEKIVKLIADRLDICRMAAVYKKQNNIPMMQVDRIKIVIDKCIELAKKHNIDTAFITEFYEMIIEHACQIENMIIDA